MVRCPTRSGTVSEADADAASRRVYPVHLGAMRYANHKGGRLDRIASATAGDGGWVDLAEPILVRAGEGFVAGPEAGSGRRE